MTSHNLHIAHARLCLLCFFKERIKKENYIVVSVSYFFLLYYPKFSGWNYLITLCLTAWLNNVDLSWVGSVEPSHFSYQLLSHEVEDFIFTHTYGNWKTRCICFPPHVLSFSSRSYLFTWCLSFPHPTTK